MINSCFVSVGFWIFIILAVFADTFNVGFIAPLLLPIHLYTPSDTSFTDNWIVLEEEGEEDDDDDAAAAAVPSVCIEYACQLNSMLKTSTADSIEADTTRDCSVVFLIVSFYCYSKYYKIVSNTICGTQKLEFYMYI